MRQGFQHKSPVSNTQQNCINTADRTATRPTSKTSPLALQKSLRHVIGDFTLTAYTLDYHCTGKRPSEPGFGITASGTHALVGRTIAVDPRVIPIGSRVFIEGIGSRIAEDTGGGVKGRHLDILFPSEHAAVTFGVKRHVRVYLEEIPR
ncbi:3D domain-containing protein [Alicyclobacillus sp. ALC3]|uniref:3D domain-containing protein n=1 Tax=Alicyclobacillus sp. ALC3 TaxID=2796143 RepID=UPI002378FD14|nr:3D domain-containing protein [Alicyclobacillus sp. ALC3]